MPGSWGPGDRSQLWNEAMTAHDAFDWDEVDDAWVPVCECGYRGEPQHRSPSGVKQRFGGPSLIAHRAAMSQLQSNAEIAAITLRQAAEVWSDAPVIQEWLEARAEHIEEVGEYALQTWPELR